MTYSARPRTLCASAKRNLRILLVAKHVHAQGDLDPDDGTHAAYHREMRRTLEERGFALLLADSYEILFERPSADFVFPLLNRGGFLNSEMLLPLLCERIGLPYLGASPILRGLADDKHLSKRVAVARGVPTAPWAIFRRGMPIDRDALPRANRHVVKPNASSASWGVTAPDGADGLVAAIHGLFAEGHDAIVEPFVPGHDIEVSVITMDGEPMILPTQIVEQDDPTTLRTYQEKRNLAPGQAYRIRPLEHGAARRAAEDHARAIMPEFMPFDYGRFEFRYDPASGELLFLEVNLNCNLWSRKTIAMAARQIGWSHADLVETILAEAMRRRNVRPAHVYLAA